MRPDRWMGVEMRHLAALEAVAAAGSFHGAADRLGYTQSAISQQVAALERIVGQRLVERPGGPRPVRLTAAGERPLEILAFEVLRCRVCGGVVVRGFEQPPIGELVERLIDRRVVGRLVPPDLGERPSDLVDVECRRQDGGGFERRHQGDVEVVLGRRRETEELGVEAPPDPSFRHGGDNT